MEQDERAAADPSEGDTEQGAEAPAAAVLASELAGAEEGVSEVDGPVRVAPPESAKKQDLEEPSPDSDDEVAAASLGVEDEDRGAFENPVAAHSAPGATVTIAHASPPDSYRRAPSRSRKQYSPRRFVAAPGSAAADGTESSSSSFGRRPPSRGRKQPRPDRFNAEEAGDTASAKARRSGIALARFLTFLVGRPPASDSEWATNVKAGNTASGASGLGTRATTPPMPAGCGPRSAASEAHAAACSPPRQRQRLHRVLRARPTGEGDSMASSVRRWRSPWSRAIRSREASLAHP